MSKIERIKVPSNSEMEVYKKAHSLLKNSRAQEFLEWISDNFPGTQVSFPVRESPSVLLHGVWTPWENLGTGTAKEVSTRASIEVGFANDLPFIHKIGMYRAREQGKQNEYGSRVQKIAPAAMQSGAHLLQVVTRVIEERKVLNPRGEEYDVLALRQKARELSFT